MMNHKSMIATAPTGSGKTIAYALGMIQMIINSKLKSTN